MSKFNIIEKYPKGQNENIIYTFIFQKDNKPKRYEAQMVYLGFREGPKWAFLDGMCGDLTNDERSEFIQEIPEFQKGGSYRKTHPIVYSAIEEVRNNLIAKEREVQELKSKLDKLQSAEKTRIVNEYEKTLSTAKCKLFEDELNRLQEETNLAVKIVWVKYTKWLLLYDVKEKRPVGVVIHNNDKYIVRTLKTSELYDLMQEGYHLEEFIDE